MDPSVKMILQSIRKNEQQQLRHVMKYLDTTLSVEQTQAETKNSELTSKQKLAKWNELRVSCIQEFFAFTYCSQLSTSLSVVGFSLTGKEIYEFMKQNTKDQFELMFEALGTSDQQTPKNEEELKKI